MQHLPWSVFQGHSNPYRLVFLTVPTRLPSYLPLLHISVLFLSVTHSESGLALCFPHRLWFNHLALICDLNSKQDISFSSLKSFLMQSVKMKKIAVYNWDMCAAGISELQSPSPRSRDEEQE